MEKVSCPITQHSVGPSARTSALVQAYTSQPNEQRFPVIGNALYAMQSARPLETISDLPSKRGQANTTGFGVVQNSREGLLALYVTATSVPQSSSRSGTACREKKKKSIFKSSWDSVV